MNPTPPTLCGVIVLILAACAAPPQPAPCSTAPRGLLPTVSSCSALYQLSLGDEPRIENNDIYRAESFQEYVGKPVPGLERYSIGGQPLMRWLSGQAVLDRTNFGDLKVVFPAAYQDAPRSLLIGRVSPEVLRELGGRELFDFLLKGKLIRPYFHLGARFCLMEEVVRQDEYRAEFSGYEEYRTDALHAQPIAFSFQVARDGTMLVQERQRNETKSQ